MNQYIGQNLFYENILYRLHILNTLIRQSTVNLVPELLLNTIITVHEYLLCRSCQENISSIVQSLGLSLSESELELIKKIECSLRNQYTYDHMLKSLDEGALRSLESLIIKTKSLLLSKEFREQVLLKKSIEKEK